MHTHDNYKLIGDKKTLLLNKYAVSVNSVKQTLEVWNYFGFII